MLTGLFPAKKTARAYGNLPYMQAVFEKLKFSAFRFQFFFEFKHLFKRLEFVIAGLDTLLHCQLCQFQGGYCSASSIVQPDGIPSLSDFELQSASFAFTNLPLLFTLDTQ